MLNKNMLECIQMFVYTDMSKTEICEKLGVAPNAISRWDKNPDFKEALRNEMHKGFDELAIKARRRLEKLIDSKNDMVALGACKEAFSRAGFDAVQKIEANVDTTINVSVIE